MNGFVKSSTIIAILLLSASVAFAAGTLRPAGGNNTHPASQSKDMGVEMVDAHAQEHSAAAGAVGKAKEDKLRLLKPKP